MPHRTGALLLIEVAFAAVARAPDERVLAPTEVELSDIEVAAAEALVVAMSDSVMSLDELEDDVWRRVRSRRAGAVWLPPVRWG